MVCCCDGEVGVMSSRLLLCGIGLLSSGLLFCGVCCWLYEGLKI